MCWVLHACDVEVVECRILKLQEAIQTLYYCYTYSSYYDAAQRL